MVLEFTVVILIGYLVGSIPFGLIIGKWIRGIDIREYGSGNIGFTNVLRTVGAKAGIATLILDVAKGAVPAWLGGEIVGGDATAAGEIAGALAAVMGHNWSVYLKFAGGKGVDTSLGGLIPMSPWVAAVCLVIGAVIIRTTRYVSVASMSGGIIASLVLTPLVITGNEPAEYLIYGIAATILIVLRHRDNIANLRAGTERRLGEKGEKR